MTPVVTCIVTHHLDENRPYLDLCLRALSESEGIDYEAIVISDAETCPEVPAGMTLVHNMSLNTATKKGHFGIAMSDPASKYFMFLSDDVVVGKHTIARLVEGVWDQAIICNPMSNSDRGGQYLSNIPFSCEESIDSFEDPADAIKAVNFWGDQFGAGYHLMVSRPYVCFYGTLIPRKVWDAVGCLDERFEVRYNDVDFCTRAARLGIPSMINFGTFALHFGSKTLKKTVTPEQYALADQAFREKYQ